MSDERRPYQGDRKPYQGNNQQGERKPYQGNKPSFNRNQGGGTGSGRPPFKKPPFKKKRLVFNPTRALVRVQRSRQIEKHVVDILREQVAAGKLKQEVFDAILTAAKKRAAGEVKSNVDYIKLAKNILWDIRKLEEPKPNPNPQ